MKIIKIAMLTAFVGLLAGCATPSSQLGFALIHSNSEPLVATNLDQASKKGEACASNVLGIIAAGDASIAKAKSNANITKVSSVDVNTFSVLGLFASKCTVVNGI